MKIAILSDIHYGPAGDMGGRRTELGAHLLQRAVQRFNRFIKPDLVLLLGDLVDLPDDLDRLREIREIVDGLDCPYVAIPGNHDPAPAAFYEIMPKLGESSDHGPVRMLCFVDPEEPGYCARRPAAGLARMRAARADGFGGTVMALQHLALMPKGAIATPFEYTNAAAVMDAMEEGGIDLSVGGHCHIASDLVQADGRAAYLSIGGLCDAPHSYTLVTVDGERIDSQVEALAMPEAYGLADQHSHTQYAYCSENMDMSMSPRVADAMGLRGLAFTEHSGQLYVPVEDYWSGRFCENGIAGVDPANSRMSNYMREAEGHSSAKVRLGLEVDADYDGRQVLHEADRARCASIVGAIHFLREARGGKPCPERFAAEFQRATAALCASGIDILAHPFRIFRRAGLDPPASLFPWLVEVLKDAGVAAELNYHTNEPVPAFFQMCLESGVKISLGSDAHALWEVGEFYPHLELLAGLGVSGDPGDVLLNIFALGSPSSPLAGDMRTVLHR